MVQEDPGGLEAAVPEQSRCCCAVTCPAAGLPIAARTPASARLGRHPGRFQTTCQPSQGKHRWQNLAAFLFKRKEEKKEPNHTKNKTNSQQTGIQGRFACSLCSVVASMHCCDHGDPALCTVAQLLPRPVARFGITSPS